MSANHIFFNNFGYKHEKPIIHMSEEIQYNLFVMEVYNNWDFIKTLMKDYKDGTLGKRKVDTLDQHWINNLVQNNIDLESFSSADDFYEKLIKS